MVKLPNLTHDSKHVLILRFIAVRRILYLLIMVLNALALDLDGKRGGFVRFFGCKFIALTNLTVCGYIRLSGSHFTSDDEFIRRYKARYTSGLGR